MWSGLVFLEMQCHSAIKALATISQHHERVPVSVTAGAAQPAPGAVGCGSQTGVGLCEGRETAPGQALRYESFGNPREVFAAGQEDGGYA